MQSGKLNCSGSLFDDAVKFCLQSVAPVYDSTLRYAIDDIVMHDSILYQCITAINNPESFTPAK